MNQRPVLLVSILAWAWMAACQRAAPGQATPLAATSFPPPRTPQAPARGFYMGLLPNAAEGQPLEEAYRQAARHAEFVPIWGRPSPFYALPDDLAGDWGQVFVGQLVYRNGMFPLLHLSFVDQGMKLQQPPGLPSASLSDPAWRARYKQAALRVVELYHPPYISLGNEVNRWYEKYGAADGPNAFQHWVSLYEETYAAIKRISPETQVFCTFAREFVAENREADLSVLEMFDPQSMDLLVFTSYPYAVRGINRPADIPSDYYSQALEYMPGKPLGFSELGWPSLEVFGGEQGQSDFIAQAAGRLTREQGVELRLFGWAWLHDLGSGEGIGLIRRDGTPKMAYNTWKAISDR